MIAETNDSLNKYLMFNKTSINYKHFMNDIDKY